MKPKKLTLELQHLIQDKLDLQWITEQILELLQYSGISISHELIFRYLWSNKKHGGESYKQLRHTGKCYNKCSKTHAERGYITVRVDISEFRE